MTGDLADALYAVAAAASAVAVVALVHGDRRAWFAGTVTCNAALAIEDLLHRAWFGAALSVALIAVLLLGNWWNRRGRKAARQLGAKSCALVEDLVEKLREAGSPVPEGAAG